VAEAARLLRDPAARSAMITRTNPYGDGQAAARIASVLQTV
jgi:UDP-N-acetylglucosamine 2-epimerase